MLPPLMNVAWSAAGRVPVLSSKLGVPEQIRRRDQLLAMLRQADAIIAPSTFLAQMYQTFGIDAARLLVWRQGVDIDRCLLRRPSNVLRVGYLGQVKSHKGVHLLVDAWSRLRGPRKRRLVLFGSDHGEESYGRVLRARIAGMDDVAWEGAFHGNEVWAKLAELDVVVVPSRWVENSPNTILEAQAMGVPVIGTNLGGTAELVRHERNGLLFAVDDAMDLARQLQRLLDEPDLLPRLRLAEPAFRTAEQDAERVAELYESLLRDRLERSTDQLTVAAGGIVD
jgi:glycosyltransferase involved in cell wall biosynthesis